MFCLQIFPPLETDQANKRPLTRLQERLIKKLGGKCVDNLLINILRKRPTNRVNLDKHSLDVVVLLPVATQLT